MPYDEFVRLQLAGDYLAGNGEGTVATGFLVAGPHNTTLPSSDKMRKTMRQDEMEGLVAVVSQTFLGLTANCGRCHDHKFDPISQKDYYRLVSALSGVTHGEREYVNAEAAKARQRLESLQKERRTLEAALEELEAPARQAALAAQDGSAGQPTKDLPSPLASWKFAEGLEDKVGKLHAQTVGSAAIRDGALDVNRKDGFARTTTLTKDVREKTLEAWVRLGDLGQRGGAAISLQTRNGDVFDAIVFGEQEPRRWMAGSDRFQRTKSFNGPEEREAKDRAVHVAIVYHGDGTIEGFRDGKRYGTPYKSSGPHHFRAQDSEVVFGLRHSPASEAKLLDGAILGAQLYDRALTPKELAISAATGPGGVSEEELLAQLTEEQRSRRREIQERLNALASESRGIDSVQGNKTYAAVPRKPPTVRVLERGDVTTPAEVVSPGGIAALQSTAWDFGLAADSPDEARRRKLAAWITDTQNPLFARVIANRLWHYHFGRGIVATPNDFGFSGARPSHPELLDWLATTMQQNGYRLKTLHRLMVTSSAYRQSSRPRPEFAAIDADNRLLWRANPRRLEAEAIRDTMLSVTRLLDPRVGGKGYRDVRHYSHRGSNFYDPVTQDGPEYYRRTVYRFNPRGARRTILDTFDCPDPSATTPSRAVTTTPLQALALLNNAFVLRMSDSLARRLKSDAGDRCEQQIARAYGLAYGRAPTADEASWGEEFVDRHGLAAYCRVLFNTNEFLYVR